VFPFHVFRTRYWRTVSNFVTQGLRKLLSPARENISPSHHASQRTSQSKGDQPTAVGGSHASPGHRGQGFKKSNDLDCGCHSRKCSVIGLPKGRILIPSGIRRPTSSSRWETMMGRHENRRAPMAGPSDAGPKGKVGTSDYRGGTPMSVASFSGWKSGDAPFSREIHSCQHHRDIVRFVDLL